MSQRKRTTITSRYNHLVEHMEILLRDMNERQYKLDEFQKDPNEDCIYLELEEIYAAWEKASNGVRYG